MAFADVLKAVDTLSSDEQESLIDILRRRLRERRQPDLAEQYRSAYADGEGLGEDFEGWEHQGVWPPE